VLWIVCFTACAAGANAQEAAALKHEAQVTAHLAPSTNVMRDSAGRSAHRGLTSPPAVLWLKPLQVGTTPFASPQTFTLMQKDKMFLPHLLVVPVGSSVAFPNADPFFHNVFSLFDGRRFDLGLYEAGSTRNVVFGREGVSYIFCNIHSEMSAVVLSLTTPIYSIADQQGVFRFSDVPDGEYDMHVWIEGQRQGSLDQLTRRIRIGPEQTDLGIISSDHPEAAQHLNKFGRPYEPASNPIY
jgi:plastocyanin